MYTILPFFWSALKRCLHAAYHGARKHCISSHIVEECQRNKLNFRRRKIEVYDRVL
uniref:Uncharacterized protein n=1 Tax=Arundo donax TaxID=35708 RepID=A0A0A9E0E0_ARUDO